MSQFIKAVFVAACGLASGIPSYAQQTEPKPEGKNATVKWRVDTQSPLGGIGGNVGPQINKSLSDNSSFSARATLGGSFTFAQDPKDGTIKSVLSPTAKGDATYHHSFLNKHVNTSVGLSAAYVRVDKIFYSTPAIKGESVNLKGSIRLVDEATVFAEAKIPVGGNLPQSKTIGIGLTPFARVLKPLDGVVISLSHTNSQFNYAEKQSMIVNSAVAGYSWKNEKGNEFFVGGVCVDVTANKANGTSAKGQSCIPWASMTINLD